MERPPKRRRDLVQRDRKPRERLEDTLVAAFCVGAVATLFAFRIGWSLPISGSAGAVAGALIGGFGGIEKLRGFPWMPG